MAKGPLSKPRERVERLNVDTPDPPKGLSAKATYTYLTKFELCPLFVLRILNPLLRKSTSKAFVNSEASKPGESVLVNGFSGSLATS